MTSAIKDQRLGTTLLPATSHGAVISVNSLRQWGTGRKEADSTKGKEPQTAANHFAPVPNPCPDYSVQPPPFDPCILPHP